MSEYKHTKRPGSDNWYIRGTDSAGRPVFRSLKTTDEETAKALVVKHQARELTERVHGRVATTTFDEAARAYIKSGGQVKYLIRETVDGVQSGLMPHFKSKLLHSITQDDLDEAAISLCRPGASRETLIRNVYTPFISVWNFAAVETRKWAEPRKWSRPKRKKGTAYRAVATRAGTSPVTYDRAWSFVSAMSPAPAMVMTMLFYSGLRPIELFALLPSDIDVSGRWGVVGGSKTGEARGFPIHEVLVPMLTALVSRKGRAVFLNRRGDPYPVTDDENNGQLKGAITGARHRLRKAEKPIDDISPYTARHTVSTQLVMNGVHPHIKDQILGHAVDDMSRHYTNLPQAPLIEAINTLPVIDAWRDCEWFNDPLVWQNKVTRWENNGRAGATKKEDAW